MPHNIILQVLSGMANSLCSSNLHCCF